MIKKLGINMPFAGNDGCYLYAEKGADKIIINMETNKLLWAAPEMLEALIECTILNEKEINYIEALDHSMYKCHSRASLISKLEKNTAIIGKATGKSWEEIKELIK